MTPKVQVLLSTYNGAVYMREQMESLLGQDYLNLHVLVRDDGSTDETPALLQEYGNHRVRVVLGQNLGVIGSFYELLSRVDPDTEFVAFCDQDDVWLPGKISRAVSRLQQEVPPDTPGLYCSAYTVVDRNLQVLGSSPKVGRPPSFANALVQNIAPGCSMVLNRAAWRLLVRYPPGPAVPVHDWWAYLVISAFGRVIYDSESPLLYRQHGGNTIGEATGLYNKWKRRLHRFLTQSDRKIITNQAREFQRLYGHLLSAECAALLNEFLHRGPHIWDRVRYALRSPVYRQSCVDDLILRCLIIIDRI